MPDIPSPSPIGRSPPRGGRRHGAAGPRRCPAGEKAARPGRGKPRPSRATPGGTCAINPFFVISARLILLLLVISRLSKSCSPLASPTQVRPGQPSWASPSWRRVGPPDPFGYDGQGRGALRPLDVRHPRLDQRRRRPSRWLSPQLPGSMGGLAGYFSGWVTRCVPDHRHLLRPRSCSARWSSSRPSPRGRCGPWSSRGWPSSAGPRSPASCAAP